MNFKNQKHSFHLVNSSPWPLFAAFSMLMIMIGSVMFFHGYQGYLINSTSLIKTGFFMILFIMITWWRDVIREGTFEGQHTSSVQNGLKLGMLLFIVSEIMFFFAFFWAFFHASFNPSPVLGGIWPPAFMATLNPWKIPLFNTILLLSSGASITLAHQCIILGLEDESLKALGITIALAIIFTFLQGLEYVTSPFTISDGIYGSTFFMTTGFHGFHVFIGTCFLTVCLIRIMLKHFTVEHHLGFEFAAWYWHFVDIVWLFLFISVYWWGSK